MSERECGPGSASSSSVGEAAEPPAGMHIGPSWQEPQGFRLAVSGNGCIARCSPLSRMGAQTSHLVYSARVRSQALNSQCRCIAHCW